MKVFLDSIGCRLNQSEMDDLGRKLLAAGHEVVEDPGVADRFVLNTCAVTREAARDARRWARKQHRLRPEAQILLTGCYATVAPEELQSIDGVKRVVPNQEKDGILALLDPSASPEITGLEVLARDWTKAGIVDSPPSGQGAEGSELLLDTASLGWEASGAGFDSRPIAPAKARTRAFVKVQDGCDKRCTFCVTTVARGAGKSRRQGDVIREIQALAGAGYAEVVLTGVHLGSYGHDLGRTEGLRDLVAAVLERSEIPRIRLSSLEPWNIAPGFFELWQNPRLMPHLHLPLQSGSDRILRRMARETDRATFRALVEAARASIPDLNITTDMICGFPGERDEDFEASLDLVRELGFGGLHVFGYSERPGTAAARMPDAVPVPLRRERVGRMIELGRSQSLDFHRRFEGREMEVLWERGRAVGPVATIPVADLAVMGADGPGAPRAIGQAGVQLGAPVARPTFAPRTRFSGYTPNYISVELEVGPDDRVDLRGRVERIRLQEATAVGMNAAPPSRPSASSNPA